LHQVFPHFDDQEHAAEIIARCLRAGGRLVILHLISRREINDLHRKAGTAVAQDMLPEAVSTGIDLVCGPCSQMYVPDAYVYPEQ
jgi:3-polyprenyl-4-hydroxybenzoate decarboxylase